MAKERIVIEIDGDSRGAVKASKQAGTSISKLGKILGGLALAGGGLFLAKKGFDLFTNAIKNSLGFLKESIKLTGEQELQEKKLAQAMKSTGKFTEKTFKSFKTYAKELQEVTRSGDEAILSVMAMLQTFKLEEDVLKDATLATLDLAAATGQDLQSAAILLGKAAVGEIGTLSRYGIIIDQAKFKAEGFQVVLDELAVEFGGQAQAQAETFIGRMDQMKNTFGDIREELGDAFIPTLTRLTEWFTKSKDVAGPLGQAIGGVASPFEKLQGWIGDAVANMENWLDLNWDNIVGIAEETFESIENFIATIKEADYTSIKDGIDELGTAFGMLKGEDGIEGATTQYQNFVDTLGEGLHGIARVALTVKAVWETLTLIIGTMTNALALGVEFLGALGLKGISLGNEGQKELEMVGFGWEALKDTAIDQNEEMKQSWDNLTKVLEDRAVESTTKVEKEFDILASDVILNFTEMTTGAIHFQNFINSMHGADIQSTHTITTIDRSAIGLMAGPRQSGGIVARNQFATDLNIPLVKGEAVLPAPLVKAIKEGQGSFAGVDAGGGGGDLTINFNGAVVREDNDFNRIADEVSKVIHNEQLREQRGGGFR